MRVRVWLTALLLGGWLAVGSAWGIDPFEFATPELRERFYRLNDELRCPKCQNQNLAGSNAEIAEDLRSEVYRLLNEGRTDAEIKSYLVERYGDYILYRPPLSARTLALWLTPPLLLFVAVFALVLLVRKHRLAASTQSGVGLDQAERERLARLLAQEQADKAQRRSAE